MKTKIEVLQNGRIHHHTPLEEERPFPTQQILQKWQTVSCLLLGNPTDDASHAGTAV